MGCSLVGVLSGVRGDALRGGVFCLLHITAYEHFIAIFTFNATHYTFTLHPRGKLV